MPKTRAQKNENVNELQEKLSRSKSAVFALYEGLPVKDIDELRRLSKKERAEYVVVKKTLLKLALKQAGIDIDPKSIPGNFATIIGYEDEVTPARVASQFAKSHENLKVVAGILERGLVDKNIVLRLAALPSKQELLAKAVGSIAAPLQGFVNVLSGNIRSLLYVLNAIKNSKA